MQLKLQKYSEHTVLKIVNKDIKIFKMRTDRFKKSFIPYCLASYQ